MPNDNRPTFDIPALTSIPDIIEERLSFLDYSTQKRNVAYLLQFLEFQNHIFDHYYTYGAVRQSILRQIVLIVTNILEYLLYVSVRQKGQTPGHTLRAWTNQAKNLRLINSGLKEKLDEVREWRNKLHPDNQKTELDFDFFTDAHVDECTSRLTELMDVLREHFHPTEVRTEAPSCPISDYHTLVLSTGQVCPYCGDIVL